MGDPLDVRRIEIPPFELSWSAWHPWRDFLRDGRSDPDALLLPDQSGVYEARLVHSLERLTIGKASNLRMRIKQGLVKGKVPHSSGQRIRKQEDTSQILIRWAVTDRPCAAEEELHKRHVRAYGRLPRYTERT